MCKELHEIRKSLGVFAKTFDGESLIPSQAAVVVRHAAAIEAMAATIKGIAAAKSAESDSWKSSGHRSAADALSSETGITPGRAKEILDTGRRLARQPKVADAALSGELSPTQAALVAEGAEADPGSVDQLLERAQGSSVGELKDEVAKVKAAAVDLETRRAAVHRARSLRSWTDRDGVWHLFASGNPEDGAQITAALSPIRRALFSQAREDGRREGHDVYMFDSLLLLSQVALGTAPTTNIADLQALGLFPVTLSAEPDSSSRKNYGRTDPDPDPDLDPAPTPASPSPPPDPTSTANPTHPTNQTSPGESTNSRPDITAPPNTAPPNPTASPPTHPTNQTSPGEPTNSRPDNTAPPNPTASPDQASGWPGREIDCGEGTRPSGLSPSIWGTSDASGPSPQSPLRHGPRPAFDSNGPSDPQQLPLESSHQPRIPPVKTRPGSSRRSSRLGPQVKLIVRVDLDALLRGAPLGDETCELVGYGPVAVSVVEDLLATNNPFISAVLTKGQRVEGVAHLSRQPNVYQQTALEWLYPTCAVKGCNARARLERDHRIDWSKTKYTAFDLLDLLCPHHHRLKTTANWALIPGTGKRAFVPRSDPRHPSNCGGDASAPRQVLRRPIPGRRN